MTWIFLNKNNSDEYIEMFAAGASTTPTCLETWHYEESDAPLVLRGIMKHKIIKRCWEDHRQFYYMDSGYLGNRPGKGNPSGWKIYHRVVPNDLQHGAVVDRPADRFQRLNIKIQTQQRNGKDILIVAPDEKPCAFYNITLDEWLKTTIDTLKQHTDRPIRMRERPVSRVARKTQLPEEWLQDVHAVVTFNSTAATEAVLAGVPVFVTAPANAARPVSNLDLQLIETPWFPDSDQIYKWACHLAYGQFHITELADGTAYRILQETKEIVNA
jgi:hypothetical protein